MLCILAEIATNAQVPNDVIHHLAGGAYVRCNLALSVVSWDAAHISIWNGDFFQQCHNTFMHIVEGQTADCSGCRT